MTDVLSKLALFAPLPEDALETVAAYLERTKGSAIRGNVVVQRGTPMERLLVLLTGTARAEIVDAGGHVMVVETFRSPDILATAMLFAPSPRFPVSVVAESSCTWAWLDRNQLMDLCQKHRSVLEAVLNDTGRRVAFLAARLRLTQFASLRQRIAVYLSESPVRTDTDGNRYIHVPHSRQELADMFGVARPSLSREIGRMVDEGLISVEENRFRLVRRDAIRALVDGCE